MKNIPNKPPKFLKGIVYNQIRIFITHKRTTYFKEKGKHLWLKHLQIYVFIVLTVNCILNTWHHNGLMTINSVLANDTRKKKKV